MEKDGAFGFRPFSLSPLPNRYVSLMFYKPRSGKVLLPVPRFVPLGETCQSAPGILFRVPGFFPFCLPWPDSDDGNKVDNR